MIGLEVDGSPAGCRACARELRRLRGVLRGQADTLAAVRSTGAGAWTGSAGEEFGRRCRDLAVEADDLVALLHDVAGGLDALADGLAAVRADLGWARDLALRGGVPVGPRGLPGQADPAWTPAQVRAHGRALTVAAGARVREEEVQAAWAATLARVTRFVAQRTGPPAVAAESGLLDRLGEASRARSLRDLVGDLLPDDLPDVVEDRLPDGAWPLPGALSGLSGLVRKLPGLVGRLPASVGPALPQGPHGIVRIGIKEFTEQWLDDVESGRDLSMWERVARAGTVGLGSGGGALAGVLLCTRARIPPHLSPMCETAGGWVGERAGEKALEVADAR